MTSSAAMTTTIVATVGSPANTPRRAIARANATVKRRERDRRAPAERRPGGARGERGAEAPTRRRTPAAIAVPRSISRHAQTQRDDRREQQRPQRRTSPRNARAAAPKGRPTAAHGTTSKRDDRGGRDVERRAIARRRHEDGRRERGAFHRRSRCGLLRAASRLPCPTSSAGGCARPTSRTSRSRS